MRRRPRGRSPRNRKSSRRARRKKSRKRRSSRATAAMKAIVGLGNPGRKYHETRHNIGFAVVDELARRGSLEFESAPVDALIAKWRQRETLLAQPMTFVNASGEAVGGLVRYFKIDPADLLIVVDDVQLPLAKLRTRSRGSAGGHNGLKS